MIAYLKGKVIHTDLETAIIDVNGVGYEVLCSSNTLSSLMLYSEVALYIHTHVREDALVLYGFSSVSEKELFLSLIKVNGVGPKLAIKILSGSSMDQFLNLIESEDVKGLSKIPKVGKKTAEQLVLSLKGKLKRSSSQSLSRREMGGVSNEIFSALIHLGFKENDVQKVIEEMPEEIGFEEGVRKGLSSLAGQR